MQKTTALHVNELLLKLKNGEGYFIIQTNSSDKSAPVFYCQLLKIEKDQPIRFEAVSFHLNAAVNQSLESSFKSLGFTLAEGENYTKFISLNSDETINSTVNEIVKIFTTIYRVDENCDYSFEEEIF